MIQKSGKHRLERRLTAHTDEIWREAPAKIADVGDDVAPKIYESGSVQENDGSPHQR